MKCGSPARVVFAALFVIAATDVWGETQDSFRLSAGLEDVPSYFPGYLANGYVSTLSTSRGTGPASSYLVGFMDYARDDISRPAQVPGWTEIDFSSSAPGTEQAWLNKVVLDERHFEGYRQVLDLHEATLTTRYRYVDRDRKTAVEVVTLVSQASPHLAATSLTITPDYDGVVQLSFPFTLWAEHSPRFPLARMSGPEMEEAIAAHGLTLEPRAAAVSDREALWYPGYTQVLENGGDSDSLSLWLDGRAKEGAAMAMASAVSLPQGVSAQATIHRDRYRLALNVSLKVERGRTYVFTKYVALSRAGWGGNAKDDLDLVREARDRGFDALLSDHRAAWDALWQADIQIEGDAKAQQVAHSELYYLMSSTSADTAWGLGPCGLSTCYAGHAFWDSDTWIFPALLLLHPERAKSMVAFRERTLDAARRRAEQHGFAGAMYPWEADPEHGSEQTPHFAYVLGDTEIHVNADVAIAQWQYYLATEDRDWLRVHGWPVIREVARFWSSRASYDPREHRYELAHVNSVAESNTDVANDTFTNVAAAKALGIAAAAAKVLRERPEPGWERISRLLYTPLTPDGQHHLPFAPKVVSRGDDFGGGPLSLLFLPSLDLTLGMQLWRNDYAYAIRPNPLAPVAAVSMGIAPRVIAAATVGSAGEASTWFSTNFTGGTLKAPFNVRTETANNNVGYFLTGSGGYLQSLIYGFSGLRLREAGLVEAYVPVLPANWNSLTLRNVLFRGQRMDIRIARDPSGVVRTRRQVHSR
ncbi:MAG: glycoside hydrolase family 65 protein [Steroidobacteraceae bacterium]